MLKENLDLGSQISCGIGGGQGFLSPGSQGENGICGRCAGGWPLERPLGLGARTHLDEEVSHPQSSSPCHATLVHRLQILQRREGRGGGELLDGGLRCRWGGAGGVGGEGVERPSRGWGSDPSHRGLTVAEGPARWGGVVGGLGSLPLSIPLGQRALLPSPPQPALTLGPPKHEPKPLTVLLLQQDRLLFNDVIAGEGAGWGGGGGEGIMRHRVPAPPATRWVT